MGQGPAPAGLADLAVLVGVGIPVGLLVERFGVPAGRLTGSFAASSVLHGAGIVSAGLPAWILIPSFVSVGLIIGIRFEGTDRKLLQETALASLGGLVVGVVVAAVGAAVVVLLTDIRWEQAMLAFAPGGLEAMTALSFLLGVDPAFVAAHQLYRFIAMAIALPTLIARLGIGDAPR